jgi:transposase InsO family protein
MVARRRSAARRVPRDVRERIGRLLRERDLPPAARLALADALGVTLRTLRNWQRRDPEEPVAPPGRPRLGETQLDELRAAVREQLEAQGSSVGEKPIHKALGGRYPLARVRRVLRDLKAERRRRIRARRAAVRVSVRVNYRDAVWSMDATHVGRDPIGRAIQAEVIREVASTRTVGIAVGSQATAHEVIALLEHVAVERGGLPLVLITDNGASYVADVVDDWCRRHRVLHLCSLPRTPQHNAASEHGMRDLKHGTPLGKGALVLDIDAARVTLEASRHRIDGHRLRRTRNWMTAVDADCRAQHWRVHVSREAVWEQATCEIRRALLNCSGKRARRRAVREAIYATLAAFSIITRTRGGRPWPVQLAESVS